MADLVDRALAGTNRSPAKSRWARSTREWHQTVAGGSGSTLENNTQNQSLVISELLQVYFDLQVFQKQPDSDDWWPMRAPLQLETGSRYRVRATTSPNKNNMIQHMDQDRVTVNLDMHVYLRTSCTVPSVSLSDVEANIVVDEEEGGIERFQHDFYLTVDHHCPAIELFLELVYEENDNEKIATRLPIELKGNYNEIDTTLWRRVGIDHSIKPPEGMALLHIETAEPGKFRLTCWNRRPIPNRPDFLASIKQPHIGLDCIPDIAGDPKKVQIIIDTIHTFFARKIPVLVEWFSQMIQQHGEKCCIIIVDETPANIPWEMLELGDGEFLGALASVVRWTHAQYGRLRALLQLQDKVVHAGKLLPYITPQDQQHAVHCPILSQLASKVCRDEKELVDELKGHLSPQKSSKVGLVYLRHSGSFVYGDEPAQLYQDFYNQYAEPVRLRFYQVQAQFGEGPVVFVNASYSARMLWEYDGPCGLLPMLLAKFPAGYIGVLGAIESTYAGRYAQDILFHINASPNGTVLSDVLLRHRREAAARYVAEPERLENQLELLYTYMYVYYGNPYARLHLRDESTGDAHEEQSYD